MLGGDAADEEVGWRRRELAQNCLARTAWVMPQVRRVAPFVDGTAEAPFLDRGSCDWSCVTKRMKITRVVSGCLSNVYGRWVGVSVAVRSGKGTVVGMIGKVSVMGSNKFFHEIKLATLSFSDYCHSSRESNVSCICEIYFCT